MAGRKSRPKIAKEDINHVLLHEHRMRYLISAELIYLSIHKGWLTPSLITERDLILLEFMSDSRRTAEYARLINRQFTPAQRELICATTDYTKRECYIYNRLHNAGLKRETIATSTLCADVYLRESKTYDSAVPDWDLINSIEKIRRKLTNQRHYKTRNSKPWEDGAEDGAIE